jgi:hypothetical protein
MVASVAMIALLSLTYAFSFVAIDKVVASNPAMPSPPVSIGVIAAIVAIGFGVLFALHGLLHLKTRPQWLDACYVHASNGFYVDATYRRLFSLLPVK